MGINPKLSKGQPEVDRNSGTSKHEWKSTKCCKRKKTKGLLEHYKPSRQSFPETFSRCSRSLPGSVPKKCTRKVSWRSVRKRFRKASERMISSQSFPVVCFPAGICSGIVFRPFFFGRVFPPRTFPAGYFPADLFLARLHQIVWGGKAGKLPPDFTPHI